MIPWVWSGSVTSISRTQIARNLIWVRRNRVVEVISRWAVRIIVHFVTVNIVTKRDSGRLVLERFKCAGTGLLHAANEVEVARPKNWNASGYYADTNFTSRERRRIELSVIVRKTLE